MQALAKGRVVLAEDEPLARQDFKEMLLQLGYDVVGEASDGASAVQLVRTLRPDVALLDIKMPGLDGIEAAKAISGASLAPVLLVSGFSEQALIERALRAGAAAYLLKPVTERKLFAAIELARERFRAALALRLEIDELREEAETERLLHRAKVLIMADFEVTEAEAQERIQSLAAKAHRSLKETAGAVLLAARTRA
ncbi:MAG TPA: response regulator [Chloroflexota bacterium]|jgi:response regulator NasT